MSQFTTSMPPGANPDANKGPEINSVTITFTAISLITICLRLFSRWWSKVEMWIDDYLIFAAAVLSWTFSGLIIVEVQQNFYGQHIEKVNAEHLASFVKVFYALSIMYPMALTLSKLSLIALYWRLFRDAKSQTPFLIIAATLVGIFICTPIRGFWHPTIKSKCVQYPIFFTSNGVLSIVFDVVVLLLPVYYISALRRSVSKRLSISSTFLIGLVVTVISGVRLWRLVLSQQLAGFDPTYDSVDAGLWAVVELNLWILVSSIPSLRPLIGKFKRSRQDSTAASSHTYDLASIKKPARARAKRSLLTSLPSTDGHGHLEVEDHIAAGFARAQVLRKNLGKAAKPEPAGHAESGI